MLKDEEITQFPSAACRSLGLDPVLREMLAQGERARKVQLPHGPESWIITGYDDNRAIYSRPEFTRQGIDTEEAPRLTAGLMLAGAIGCQKDKTHAALRQAATRVLDRTMISQVEDIALRTANELVDSMRERGDGCDFVRDFARPYSIRVLCQILGIPGTDEEFVIEMVGAILAGGHSGDAGTATEASTRLGVYIIELVNERQRNTGSDFISRVVSHTALSTYEVVVLTYAMVMGGFETTANMLAKSLARLLVEEELVERVRHEPARIPDIIDELLRLTSVAGGEGIPWLVREPVEIAGMHLQPGDYVVPAPGAANRDPAVFDNPEELRLGRDERQHQTLGYAAHYCLGNKVARVELDTAFRVLLERFSGLRLAVDIDDLDWDEESAIWHLRALPISWRG
ncbi:cytochrome P450 [Nocardia sp. GTS18]|uniref:cytochrome P450 n=1 Tax=Nocardia sp. GTS18 TaxID=1778064 RepID=UPI0015EF997B